MQFIGTNKGGRGEREHQVFEEIWPIENYIINVLISKFVKFNIRSCKHDEGSTHVYFNLEKGQKNLRNKGEARPSSGQS
jgi:hypothetical protein